MRTVIHLIIYNWVLKNIRFTDSTTPADLDLCPNDQISAGFIYSIFCAVLWNMSPQHIWVAQTGVWDVWKFRMNNILTYVFYFFLDVWRIRFCANGGKGKERIFHKCVKYSYVFVTKCEEFVRIFHRCEEFVSVKITVQHTSMHI